jgi:hypothetical protein
LRCAPADAIQLHLIHLHLSLLKDDLRPLVDRLKAADADGRPHVPLHNAQSLKHRQRPLAFRRTFSYAPASLLDVTHIHSAAKRCGVALAFAGFDAVRVRRTGDAIRRKEHCWLVL